ncbi:transcription initiation factor TFIID subunit 7-like [Acanthaster planci]|uniref:Transcription initiation factor TFIID subunit 7-like n=1 Tax=Acanthaster planci TaxID=133434 RepID=A0A8B7XHZ1_ACAPL|nr:transcription initiation factor TFIID subunit 7-like [Acanthaster planci]XP_022079541.1 transcription initiation factor TFIID subunit 7-like [Acanthaster planci]
MSSNSSKTKNPSKAKSRPSATVRRNSPASSRPSSRPGGSRGGNGSRSGTPKPKGGGSGRSTPSSNRPAGSTAKVNPATQRKEDPLPELENHFILRMPEHAVGDMRKIINTGSQILKDKLAIEMMGDMRHGTVKFNDEVYSAKLMDLPSIMESHKTIDKKTFWKTADICQMLVCSTEEQAIETEMKEKELEEKGLKRPDRVDKKFMYNHGITPPLKNVRKRRFRKTAKKKYIEAPDVEEEVKRLLRMDSTAIKIRWEVLAEEDIKDENRNENMPGVSHGSAEGDDLTRIFGDVSSSEDEDEDINILDMDEDTRDSGMMGEEPVEMEEEVEDELEDEDSKMGMEESEQPNEFVNRLDELRKELSELEEKQRALEESISTVDNMLLKDRFQSQLNSVLEDIKIRQKEVETLEVLIGDG